MKTQYIRRLILAFLFLCAYNISWASFDYEWVGGDGNFSDSGWDNGAGGTLVPGGILGSDNNYGIDGAFFVDINESTTFGYTINNIFMFNDAVLAMSNSNVGGMPVVTVTVNNDLLLQSESGMTIGPSVVLNADIIGVGDNLTYVTLNGGTVVLSENVLFSNNGNGGGNSGNGNGDNGSPVFTINSGSLTCANIDFDDEIGDNNPQFIMNGGTVTVSSNLTSSGNPIDLEITAGTMTVVNVVGNSDAINITVNGTGTLNITGNILGGSGGVNITVEGGGALNLDGSFTGGSADNTLTINGTAQVLIEGNLSFTAGNGAVTMGDGQLTLEGNWENAGTNSIDGGTIIFDGNSQQTVSNSSGSGIELFNVTLTHNNGLVFSDDVDISGTFSVPNPSTVTVGGDWTNSGTNSVTGSTITFNSGSAQQITGSSVSGATFYNLVLDNSSGLTLNTNTTITNSFVFTSGVVTPTNTLTFNDGATATSTSTSYVNGSVIKIGDNDFTFPLSSQISISSVSPIETFTAQYSAANGIPIYGSDRADGIDHVSSLEHWVLDRAGGASATVTLQWNAGSDVGPDAAAWDKLLLCRWDGSEWVSHGGGGSGTLSSGTVSGSVSDFSPFTFGSTDKTNPLPVEFLYFEASIYAEVVEIDWATATEIDNDKFEVERSVDGVKFEKIGEVIGNGDSNIKIEYAFDDITFSGVFSEDIYYRLKQIDYDGEFEYSEIARVYRPLEKKTLEVVPNPYSSSFDLQFVATQPEKVSIRVLDMNGKSYYSSRYDASKGPNSFTIDDLYNIPVGLYLVNIQGSTISFTERVLKRNN
jgi:hypothetical protein